MKKIFLSVVVLSMVAVGCAKNKSAASANGGVTDLSPAAQPAYTPPPSVAAQPVVSETPASLAAASTPADTSTASMGSSYKVKKGDTLFSIAKAKYGDGKQWHKIASANPGVTPQSLKVGQTLNVP